MKLKNFIPKFSGFTYVIILCAFLKAVAFWSLTPYLPLYLGSYLGLGIDKSGYLIGLGSLSGVLMSIFCGFLVDRVDKGRMFLITLAVITLSYLLFPQIVHILVLLFLLMVINIASSSNSIVSNTWLSLRMNEEESTKAFSLKYILENIGAMVGPLLGTVFASRNRNFPFFLAAGSLLLSMVMFMLHRGLSKPSEGNAAPEASQREGIRRTLFSLLRDKRLLFFTAGGLLSMMVYGALVTFMSLFFSVSLPYDIALQRVAYISALNAAIVMGAQYFISALVNHKTILMWIRAAIVSMIVGLVILTFSTNFIFLTIAIVFLSFGEISIVPAEYLFIIKITPNEQRGLYLGAQNLIYLGLSLSPLLCGFLLKELNAQVMFLSLCAVLVISLLFYHLGYNADHKKDGLNPLIS